MNKTNPLKIILSLALLLVLTSCAGKSTTSFDTKAAHLRWIGVVTVGPNEKAAKIVEESIDELYGSRFVILPVIEKKCDSVCSSTLHQAGLNGLHDVVVVETGGSDAGKDRTINADLYNLEDLKRYFQLSVPFDEKAKKNIKLKLSENIKDLNSNPKADRATIAQHLEERDELEMAYDVLKKKKEDEYTILIQDIDKKDEIDSKLRELDRKIQIEKCYLEDSKAKFAIKVIRKGLSDEYFAKFKSVIRKIGLIGVLKKYTSKPVRIRVHFDPDTNSSAIWLEMRYDPKWYASQTKNIPGYVKNKRTISFEPYMKVMSKIVELKEKFAGTVSINQRENILGFNTVFVLTKPCDDTLTITVSKGSSGQILHPYYLRVHLTGFSGETTLSPIDKEIFNSSGMFSMGPARLISGEKTTFGILYDFLEIKE